MSSLDSVITLLNPAIEKRDSLYAFAPSPHFTSEAFKLTFNAFPHFQCDFFAEAATHRGALRHARRRLH